MTSRPSADSGPLLTTGEIAKHFRVSEMTVRRWAASADLADLDDDDVFNIAALSQSLKQGDGESPDEVLARYRSPDGSPADDRDAARAEILSRYRQLTEAEAGPPRLP